MDNTNCIHFCKQKNLSLTFWLLKYNICLFCFVFMANMINCAMIEHDFIFPLLFPQCEPFVG